MAADHTPPLQVGSFSLNSRLVVGTGKYETYEVMQDALAASGCDTVTVAVRRERLLDDQGRSLLDFLDLADALTEGDAEAEDEAKRPRTYAKAFEKAACVDAQLCKQLSYQQLKDEIGIKKVGHLMKLMEQFKFL